MRLFDLHCDTLMLCEEQKKSFEHNDLHLDLSRGLAAYEKWVQVMAAYVPDGLSDAQAWARVCRELDYLEEQAKHTSLMQTIYRSSDLKEALETKRCAVLPAVENGIAVGRDLSHIQALSKRGVVYINITWNGENPLGFGCMTESKSGLKPFGKEAVTEMFRCHILPDVSHLNEAGFWDVAMIANGRPFIAGHSVSKSVTDHPRNLNDEQFETIKASGGLVGLNLCADQLGEQSFSCVEQHLAHFLSRGGEDVLALGLDLDGTDIPSAWRGIEVAAQLYNFLCDHGYAQSTLEKIFFENAHAFFVKSLTIKEDCITIGS